MSLKPVCLSASLWVWYFCKSNWHAPGIFYLGCCFQFTRAINLTYIVFLVFLSIYLLEDEILPGIMRLVSWNVKFSREADTFQLLEYAIQTLVEHSLLVLLVHKDVFVFFWFLMQIIFRDHRILENTPIIQLVETLSFTVHVSSIYRRI